MSAPIRSYLVVIITAFVGTLQHGYHHAVYNQPITIMQRFVNESYREATGEGASSDLLSILWSLTVSLFAGGLLFGSVCGSSMVIDKFGRKPALQLASLIGIVGCALEIMAFFIAGTAFWLLPVGRFVIGVAIGVGTNSQAVFLSEIAPVNARGTFGVMATLFLAIGTLVANIFGRRDVLGSYELWYTLSIIPIFLCLAFLVASFFIPESPKFLATRKQRDDLARQSLHFYNKAGTDVEDVLEMIKLEHSDDAGLKGLWRLIRQYPGYRKAFLVAIMSSFIVPFSGVFLMYSYLADVGTAAGLSPSLVDALSLVYPSIDIVCNVIGSLLIERVGRRKLCVFGSWAVTAALLTMGVCQVLLDNHIQPPTIPQDLIIVAVIAHVIIKATSVAGVSFVLPYELFPTPVRGAVASYICALGIDLGDLLLLFAYLPVKEKIGGYSLIVLFVLPMLVIATILTLYAPETMGRHVSQVYISLMGGKDDGIHKSLLPGGQLPKEEEDDPYYGSLDAPERKFTEGEKLDPVKKENLKSVY